MNNIPNSNYSEDNGYVNIHGQDIRVYQCDRTGRILIPIDELKTMGFRLYRKSQYSKLLIDDSQFSKEFELYMLQSAQSYMLQNKVAFKENDILESINKCKMMLVGGQTPDRNSDNFARTHTVEANSNHDLTITTPNEPPRSVQKFKGFTPNRSPRASTNHDLVNSTTKSYNEDRQLDQGSEKGFKIRNGNRSSNKEQFDKNNQEIQNKNDQLKNRIEKKKFDQMDPVPCVELNKPEHNVLITHVDKQIIYAQDTDRAEDLLAIDKLIKEEMTKNLPKVSTYIYNKIYLGEHEGEWYRCRVIKFRPPQALFIDYGNTKEVNELLEVSGPLTKIPCQSVRLQFKSHLTPALYEIVDIRISRKTESGTYVVELKSESGTTIVTPKEPAAKIVPSTQPATPTFTTKPSPLCKLENNQRVMIISHTDGRIALRTRECYDKLKQIEDAIENRDFKPVDRVVKGQVILCKNGKLQRAVVTNNVGSNVEVELLDYYETKKTNLSNIHHIDDSLAVQPITYILTPQIKGYNEEAVPILQDLGDRKAKATVVLNDADFDLNLGKEGLLSEKITPKVSDNRPIFSNFKKFKPDMGPGDYFLNTYRDPNHVYFGSAEALQDHLGTVMKSELPGEPYEPVENEVCFGLYQEEWSRCVIRRVTTARYEVEFIDFGNVEFLNAGQLRPLTDDAREVPALAIHCRLIGLPYVANAEEVLKNILTDGESFEIEVKREVKGVYEIEIPSVYKRLKSGA